MAYSPKKLRPAHLQMIRLHWQGEDNQSIAALTGYTPQQVSNIVNSEEAQQLLAGLQSETMDTMKEVIVEAQYAAPLLFDNVYKMAFSAGDERVRLHANLALLGIAGHVPVRRIQVEGDTAIQKKYEDMSDEEIRNSIAGDIGSPAKGPDGNILQ